MENSIFCVVVIMMAFFRDATQEANISRNVTEKDVYNLFEWHSSIFVENLERVCNKLSENTEKPKIWAELWALFFEIRWILH